MNQMAVIGYREVLIAAVLVLLSIAISRWWRIPVQKDMALGSVRAFVQLVLVGYALEYVFALESIWLILLAIMVMIIVGAHAAAGRVSGLRRAITITSTAMIAGSLLTLGFMLLLDIITLEARYVIPLAGMIIGNSMNASALTIGRISADIRSHRLAIETALSLGKSWRQATRPYQKEAAVAGMLSMLNFLKTVGIVALPGAMTGMILAGVDPLDAVLLQIVVGYMLLSAVTITSVVALELTVRRFFSPFHQLILNDSK
ncbi:MAG TPA: iron export ABC transporter permease subunit FetB [Acidobacteriota bacterium]|nr:iron export ABC transporter permease subunit FetB [Acidobacteriota bacterium]